MCRRLAGGKRVDLETTGYYALGLPALALVVLLEVLRARRAGKKIFGFAETISNLSAFLGTLIIGIFTGPLVYALYDGAQRRYGLIAWGDSPWRWPFALFVGDFCYYAWHRAGHTFGALWAIHGVHHQHEHLNSTVGLRLEWIGDVGTIPFFSLMPLLGIDATAGFVAIASLSLYTLTTHSPVLARPTWGFLVTPATHGSHHSRDARFLGKNFGAMFLFWDRLLGTYGEPDGGLDALRNDVPTICRSHDGVSAQWGLVVELARKVFAASSFGEAARLVLGPPVLEVPSTVPRDEAQISRPIRAFVVVDFIVILLVSAWILRVREAEPLAARVYVALSLLWGLRTIGGLLDGRRGALREELVRLAVLPALAIFIQLRSS
jgi:sterol desaturase/sphingolipid hydroxylase (fatty acid hydroxylase superfamily)